MDTGKRKKKQTLRQNLIMETRLIINTKLKKNLFYHVTSPQNKDHISVELYYFKNPNSPQQQKLILIINS